MSAPVMVAVAQNPAEAQIWVDALRDAGIEAGTYQRGPAAAFGGGRLVFSDYPVLVAHENIGDARNVIAELGGAGALSALAVDDGSTYSWQWLLLPVVIVGALIAFLIVTNAT